MKQSVTTDSQQLSAQQKRDKIAELLQSRSSRPNDRQLSIGQERLYHLARLSPGEPHYNVAAAYRLRGPLNAKAVEHAVRHIEERHAILRTRFPLVDGNPVQRIGSVQAHSDGFVQINLDMTLDTDQAERASQAIESEVSRAIDIAQGPLWRVALIRLSAQEHILVLTMHHIITDGWSFEVFFKELRALYRSYEEGNVNPLPQLPIQYCDYADQQRKFFAEPEFEKQQRYWIDHLAGSIPRLHLPAERLGSAQHDERACQSFSFTLSRELSQSLSRFSQSEGTSLFMTMLTAFAALLHGSTKQDDVLLCTPVTGRHRAQSRDLIGYFNNILPMRLDLSGDPSLLELLRKVRCLALDAYKNQDVPFQWNADLPSLRRIPLSRLLFSFDMEWPPKFDLKGIDCKPIAVDTGTADFDLSVSLWSSQSRILGNFRFKENLFDETSIGKIVDGYRVLLETLVAEPERVFSTLPQIFSGNKSEPFPTFNTQHDKPHSPGIDLPRSPLESRLAQEWEDALGHRSIGIRDDLRSLGASSLAVASLAERIKSVFRTDLPVAAIFQAGTIEKMAALLVSRDKSILDSPLAPIQPQGAKLPLFLCEGVGLYYSLVSYLGDDQPVFGLVSEIDAQYPRIEDLASHYVSAILETQSDGPYLLGGASFGGLVAFEMAQQLHGLGRRVGLLVLIDTPGPQAYRLKPPLRRMLGHASNAMRFGYPYVKTKLADRFPKLIRKSKARKHEQLGSTSDLVVEGRELRRLFRRSASNYDIKPYAGRITLFMLSQRDGMSDALFDPALGDVDPLLGWGHVAADGVEKYELAGEHLTILKEPFVQTLGAHLRQCLEHAQLGNSA